MKSDIKSFSVIKLLPLIIMVISGGPSIYSQVREKTNSITGKTPPVKTDDPLLVQIHNPNAGLWGTHDPVLIRQDSTWYLFSTGNGVSVSSSSDTMNWKREQAVFSGPPSWLTPEIIPGYRGNSMWAPDISFVNGTYYLYYSVPAFGKNTSVIGVATNRTLNRSDDDFKWIDHGIVLQSVPNRDMWNAIDPNLIIDNCQGWLCFGSFWGGIKMVKLSDDLLSVAKPEAWYTRGRYPCCTGK